jgi:hypothetical protein
MPSCRNGTDWLSAVLAGPLGLKGRRSVYNTRLHANRCGMQALDHSPLAFQLADARSAQSCRAWQPPKPRIILPSCNRRSKSSSTNSKKSGSRIGSRGGNSRSGGYGRQMRRTTPPAAFKTFTRTAIAEPHFWPYARTAHRAATSSNARAIDCT